MKLYFSIKRSLLAVKTRDFLSYLFYVVIPKWSKGLVCKTSIYKFESYSQLN